MYYRKSIWPFWSWAEMVEVCPIVADLLSLSNMNNIFIYTFPGITRTGAVYVFIGSWKQMYDCNFYSRLYNDF